MSSIISTWAASPITIQGALASAEWGGAGKLELWQGSSHFGTLMVKNDATYLYVALDVGKDLGNDPGTGDYFWFIIDTDRNSAITPNVDVMYSLYPGQPNHLGRWFFLGPGTLKPASSTEVLASSVHIGFGASPNSTTPHRIWEMRIALSEIGVSLTSSVPPSVRFGVRLASSNPGFVVEFPPSPSSNFSNLHEIFLTTSPTPAYPPGAEGPVIGGVGLIPFTAIDATTGLATTASTYYLAVTDAAFGGTMHLVANHTTMIALWAEGARKYRILHGEGAAGALSPLAQAWTNYHWNGTTYVLENFGPDSTVAYRLTDPSASYSISNLLLQWQSSGFNNGLHRFQAVFLREDGTVVPTTAQTVTLMVDNNLPNVQIDSILHGTTVVAPCDFVTLTSATDGIRFTITAKSVEGHMRSYGLVAMWGDNQHTDIPGAASDYSSHISASHSWTGVDHVTVPAGVWVPPVTCAYQFRLSATPRVTNGYGWIGYAETDKSLTIIKPKTNVLFKPLAGALPFGIIPPTSVMPPTS